MNLTEAATLLGVSGKILRLAVERREIEAEHPPADGPWVINQRALETDTRPGSLSVYLSVPASETSEYQHRNKTGLNFQRHSEVGILKRACSTRNRN